jgi:hypothetical protein
MRRRCVFAIRLFVDSVANTPAITQAIDWWSLIATRWPCSHSAGAARGSLLLCCPKEEVTKKKGAFRDLAAAAARGRPHAVQT